MQGKFQFIGAACFSFAAILSLVHSVRAQEHPNWLLGPKGGYNAVTYTTDPFPMLSADPKYYLAQNGKGRGFFAFLSGENVLSRDMHNFFIFEVGYDSKPADFSTSLSTHGDTTASLSASLAYYLVNLGYKFNFMRGSLPMGPGIQICLSIGIKDDASFIETISIPPNRAGYSTAISSAQALRFSVRPELSYDIPCTENWVLTPSLGYDAPLNQVDIPENWNASSFYAGMALRYAM